MTQTSTFQVILSTDGKHTVIATADQKDQAEAAVAWATQTYDRLVNQYGLKHEQYQKPEKPESDNGHAGSDIPMCAVHLVPMVRQNGRHGPFWSCHRRNEDGGFCNYKPSPFGR